jgi:hypothetical protein
VTEDIVGNNSNGWDGMFSLNRELFIYNLKNVSTNDPKLNLNASWYAEDNESSQTKTVKTLGIKSLGEYYSLRNESKHWGPGWPLRI